MFPARTRVYFAIQPVDLRRSFDGLSTTAQSVLDKDPSKGGLFVFLNKRGDQVRVLFRDRHGWCVLSKRLDEGRFDRSSWVDGLCRETDAAELIRFLEAVVPPRHRVASLRLPMLSIVEQRPLQ